jgi:hypothetical protein
MREEKIIKRTKPSRIVKKKMVPIFLHAGNPLSEQSIFLGVNDPPEKLFGP